eukprot:TRINITY_DN7410_c0_g1_i2.p1 TRINITY_DN7410_c0_g1~~TRINITY_DN7410_c0_g1_i2.p1  ORF type:complete len:327 (-),score=82.54 TRINITY_DN7410_c0_g1_i2:39-1019(-)
MAATQRALAELQDYIKEKIVSRRKIGDQSLNKVRSHLEDHLKMVESAMECSKILKTETNLLKWIDTEKQFEDKIRIASTSENSWNCSFPLNARSTSSPLVTIEWHQPDSSRIDVSQHWKLTALKPAIILDGDDDIDEGDDDDEEIPPAKASRTSSDDLCDGAIAEEEKDRYPMNAISSASSPNSEKDRPPGNAVPSTSPLESEEIDYGSSDSNSDSEEDSHPDDESASVSASIKSVQTFLGKQGNLIEYRIGTFVDALKKRQDRISEPLWDMAFSLLDLSPNLYIISRTDQERIVKLFYEGSGQRFLPDRVREKLKRFLCRKRRRV